MSKISGILCTILRRYVESEHANIAFAAACEKAGCDCAGGTFSVAQRVDQESYLRLVGQIALQAKIDEDQYFENLGRSVASILKSSYPTTFRTLSNSADFTQTAVSIDYSILFPAVSDELAAVLWSGRQQGRETVFSKVPDRRSANYLRGFYEGTATVVGEPVAVRLAQENGGFRVTVVAGRAAPGGDEKRPAK